MYAVNILLARLMGVEHYGFYAYALAWIVVLSQLGTVGTDGSLLRYVAAYRTQENWPLLRGILRRGDQLAFAAALTAAGGILLVTWVLKSRIRPEMLRTFWVASAALPLMTLTLLRQASLRALGHPVAAASVVMLLRPALLALPAAAVVALSSGLTGPMAMAALALSYSGTFLAGGFALGRRLPRPVTDAPPAYRTREWLSMALPMFVMSGMGLLLHHTDTMMIGAMLGTREAGVYSVAARTARLMLFGLLAVNAVLGPMVSSLHVAGRTQEIRRIAALAARGVFAFSLPVAAALLLAGQYVLGAFGDDFAAAYWPLAMLVSANLVNALCGPVGLLMTMTGRQNLAAVILGVSALLNVALNAILIPWLGIVGAALATGVSMIVWNAWMLVHVLVGMGINPTVFARRGRVEGV